MASSERTSVAPICRYTFITLHILLWLTIFLISIILTGQVVLLIIHCITGGILLIYLPATIILSARNSSSRFDSAGVEVAYIVIQLAAWLASGIVAIIIRINSLACHQRIFYAGEIIEFHIPACDVLDAVAALSFIDVILLSTWLGMVVFRARRTTGKTPNQAFKIPTHQLINGDVTLEGGGGTRGFEKIYRPAGEGGAFDVNEAEAETGMVNPFSSSTGDYNQPHTPSPRGTPLLHPTEMSENHLSPFAHPSNEQRRYSDRSGASSPDPLMAEARLYSYSDRSGANSPEPVHLDQPEHSKIRRYSNRSNRSRSRTPDFAQERLYSDRSGGNSPERSGVTRTEHTPERPVQASYDGMEV